MIERFVGNGEKSLAKDEEDLIKNVAAMAIEGTFLYPWYYMIVDRSLYPEYYRGFGYGGCPGFWIPRLQLTFPKMFSTVQTMFVAMSLYPTVQKRAQAELDAVVGPDRLPDFEDRDMLVYVNALIREALRWQNVLPFAVPHTTVKDDEFRGYFVPAGTNIFPNVWYVGPRGTVKIMHQQLL